MSSQPKNESHWNKLKTVQYNAALAITGSIQRASKVKLYKELGLESLKSRRWFRCLCCFYKIKTFGLLSYLSNLISSSVHSYNIQNLKDVVTYHCRIDTFKYSLFSWTICEWNKLDLILLQSSYTIFRNYLLTMIHHSPNLVYDIHKPLGLCLLTRLRLGLSHINECKFYHDFENYVNPLNTCSLEIESTLHFFLYEHCWISIASSFFHFLCNTKLV